MFSIIILSVVFSLAAFIIVECVSAHQERPKGHGSTTIRVSPSVYVTYGDEEEEDEENEEEEDPAEE